LLTLRDYSGVIRLWERIGLAVGSIRLRLNSSNVLVSNERNLDPKNR
jgi:hypothetical protein